MGSIPGSGRSPREGNGYPLQYSCQRIPWTEEPGGLQSMGSQRVGHGWADRQTDKQLTVSGTNNYMPSVTKSQIRSLHNSLIILYHISARLWVWPWKGTYFLCPSQLPYLLSPHHPVPDGAGGIKRQLVYFDWKFGAEPNHVQSTLTHQVFMLHCFCEIGKHLDTLSRLNLSVFPFRPWISSLLWHTATEPHKARPIWKYKVERLPVLFSIRPSWKHMKYGDCELSLHAKDKIKRNSTAWIWPERDSAEHWEIREWEVGGPAANRRSRDRADN